MKPDVLSKFQLKMIQWLRYVNEFCQTPDKSRITDETFYIRLYRLKYQKTTRNAQSTKLILNSIDL